MPRTTEATCHVSRAVRSARVTPEPFSDVTLL